LGAAARKKNASEVRYDKKNYKIAIDAKGRDKTGKKRRGGFLGNFVLL